MADLQHLRAPDWTGTQTTAVDRESPLFNGALLGVRLWLSTDTGLAGRSLLEAAHPAVWLVIDLLEAGGGAALAAQGSAITARFPSIQEAVLMARRLSWALLAFAGNDRFHTLSSAVLVLSGESLLDEASSSAQLLLLAEAQHGQVLVDEKAAALLTDLPGLSLQAAPISRLQAVRWMSDAVPSSEASDEAALLRLISSLGLEDPCPPQLDEPALTAPKESTATFAGPSLQIDVPGDALRPRSERPAPPAARSRWLLGSGIGAAVIGLAVIGAITLRHGGEQSSSANQPIQPGPSSGHSQPASTQNSASQDPEKPAQSSANPKPPEPPPSNGKPKRPAAEPQKKDESGTGCDFGKAGVQRILDRAERSLHADNLRDAQQQFQLIVACDPRNSQALDGLNRVRARKEAQR